MPTSASTAPTSAPTPPAFRFSSAQRVDAEALAADAEARGWIDEAERHRRLVARLDTLLAEDENLAG